MGNIGEMKFIDVYGDAVGISYKSKPFPFDTDGLLEVVARIQ